MVGRLDGVPLVIRGGRVIGGSGQPPRPRTMVVSEGDRIGAVVSGGAVVHEG